VADPLSSSRYSIEHAKRHIDNLEREIVAFLRSKPYTVVIETNAQCTEDSHKVKLTKPMPVTLPGIAFDALNNLRPALDQAGYAVALATGKVRPNDAHFPFGKNAADVQHRIKGRSKDLPKEIFDVMVSFEPYETGKGLLWALNELCNTHKHELVIPCALATGGGTLKHAFFDALHAFTWPPQWDTAKQEMEIARVPYGATPSYNFQVQTFIALGKVKRVERQPADGILNAMLREVESVVMAVEAEARRLGLFI